MKTVAIIEGFSGGPMKTRMFRKALEDAGLIITKDRRHADIVVAHSAGIYAIPANSKANLLILIGPTFWPGRSLFKRMVNHVQDARELQLSNHGRRYYYQTKALELYYFFTRHKYMWLGILYNNKLGKLNELVSAPSRRTIIIRNRSDSYSGPGLEEKIKSKNVEFVELPGIHDDYYTNPEPYIKLIKEALKT